MSFFSFGKYNCQIQIQGWWIITGVDKYIFNIFNQQLAFDHVLQGKSLGYTSTEQCTNVHPGHVSIEQIAQLYFTSLHYTLSEKFQCKYSLHSNTIFLIYFLRSANENSRITSFVSLPARATPISPFMNFQWYMEVGRRSDFIESTPAICCFLIA